MNAITPMTFLFVDTIITQRDIHVEPLNAEGVVHTDNVMYITRTGQAVSLIYLSFYEPDMAFKCANVNVTAFVGLFIQKSCYR